VVYKRILILLSLLVCTLNFAIADEDLLQEYCLKNQLRPLHILFVVGHFPSPSQTFVLNIMTGLIDAGHNVSIFSTHKDTYSFMHPNIEKYKLLDHVMYEKLPLYLPNYDIVFCQFGYLGNKILKMKNLRKWLRQRKLVVCFRGSDISAHMQGDHEMYARLFRKADLFLPVCDYFKNKLITLGCNPKKIAVHYSAIDCSQFFFEIRKKPEEETIHLISVCRLVKKKGIDYAVKAIAQLIQKHPQIHFTIVGDGPERSYLQLLIRQLRLQDKVTLYGWGTQEQVVALLARSHIFLLPSRTSADGNEEGIANALKEAMAMGLISIATWHAGTPELIDDGVSGFLVPEKHTKELAKKIGYVIEHPEIWESVGVAARKKVEGDFETEQSIQKLEKLFYRVLERV